MQQYWPASLISIPHGRARLRQHIPHQLSESAHRKVPKFLTFFRTSYEPLASAVFAKSSLTAALLFNDPKANIVTFNSLWHVSATTSSSRMKVATISSSALPRLDPVVVNACSTIRWSTRTRATQKHLQITSSLAHWLFRPMHLGQSRLHLSPLACPRPSRLDSCRPFMQAAFGQTQYIQPAIKGQRPCTTNQGLGSRQSHTMLVMSKNRAWSDNYGVSVGFVVPRKSGNRVNKLNRRCVHARFIKCIY